MLADQVERSFPDVARISDPRLRDLVREMWRYVSERNPVHTDIESVPMHPTFPLERVGSVGAHMRAIAAVARTLVPTYAREWRIELDLDHFLLAAFTHDAAKVIEFVERDGRLVATPGFDHALEGARIARELGFPVEVVHMIAVHTYVGPLRLPRTRSAQLLQFLDPLCLPVFPEDGKSSVERHLEANGFPVPSRSADVR